MVLPEYVQDMLTLDGAFVPPHTLYDDLYDAIAANLTVPETVIVAGRRFLSKLSIDIVTLATCTEPLPFA